MKPMNMILFCPEQRCWGGKMRLVGETDKFLLSELPLEGLLDLRCTPREKFGKELYDILSEIGIRLGVRLFMSDMYVLPFEDWVKDLHILTQAELANAYKDISFMGGVGEIWNKVKPDPIFTTSFEKVLEQEIFLRKRYESLSLRTSLLMKRAKKKQLKRLIDETSKGFCQETVHLYGILVYARTLFESKGGRWADITPLKRGLQ